MDGQDDFADPPTMNDYYSNPAVLLDEIPDRQGGSREYAQEITVPNVDCNNCTLQLIQVMYDKPPYGDGNDMYYQCADIIIEADPNAPAPDMGNGGDDMGMGEPDMGAGCTVDADCMAGETCNNGMCEAGDTSDCALDSHCAAGEICEFGACVVGTRPDGNNTAGNNNTGGNNTNGGDPNGQDDGGDDDESCASAGSSAPAPIGLLLIALVALRVRRRRETRG
jgi:MYXO-CTERM domain-containing protein